MMKKVFFAALFCMSIILAGCGDYAASHSEADIDMTSHAESLGTEQSSEAFIESCTESSFEDDSNSSCADESYVISDAIDDDNISEFYSEVEIDFSEFE